MKNAHRNWLVLAVCAAFQFQLMAASSAFAEALMCGDLVPFDSEASCPIAAPQEQCTYSYSVLPFLSLSCTAAGNQACELMGTICTRTGDANCSSRRTACYAHVASKCSSSPATATLDMQRSLGVATGETCDLDALERAKACLEAAEPRTCTTSPFCAAPAWPRGNPNTGLYCAAPDNAVAIVGRFHPSTASSDVFYYSPGAGTARLVLHDSSGPPTDICYSSNFMNYDHAQTSAAIALDYDNDGMDDLLTYQPGVGTTYLYHSNVAWQLGIERSSCCGIGGYDFKSASDRVLAIDYNGDEKKDLLMWRPGTGKITISKSLGVKVNGDVFTPFYSTNSAGLAGYDLRSTSDRILPIDFNGDGKQDLILYRPGTGKISVVKSNGESGFSAVYASNGGIGGYDLHSPYDRIVATDYNGDGKQDIVVYRPGSGIIYVERSNGNGTFTTTQVWAPVFGGAPGFDLMNTADVIQPIDFDGDGFGDLLFFRPGGKLLALWRSNGGDYNSFSVQFATNTGMIAFNETMADPHDTVSVFDANADGKQDLLLFRSVQNVGRAFLSRGDGTFDPGVCDAACGEGCTLSP